MRCPTQGVSIQVIFPTHIRYFHCVLVLGQGSRGTRGGMLICVIRTPITCMGYPVEVEGLSDGGKPLFPHLKVVSK